MSAAPTKLPDPRVLDRLGSAQSVVLCGHEHPDGDVLGSQCGLYHLLRSRGQDVRIVNPDPPSRSFDFLAEHTPFEAFGAGAPLSSPDLIVMLDCSELRRLRDLGDVIRQLDRPILVVDHHIGSENGDGGEAFVDSSAAATGEMVARLYDAFEARPSREAAEGLFTAFVSDTGWFRYSNTDASVFGRVAELMQTGLDVDRIDGQLNRRSDPGSVQCLASGLEDARFELEGRFASLALTKPQIDEAGRNGLDLDRIMEPLRAVDGIEVVAMLKEQGDGAIKVSLRSQADVDVQRIARELGGGGHRKAAGATVRGAGSEELRGRLRDRVLKALIEGGAA
ncbi:MAG: bifunctional oligoribonuclease/PAP phosphatase NrnA [Planctomycetota bacterium]